VPVANTVRLFIKSEVDGTVTSGADRFTNQKPFAPSKFDHTRCIAKDMAGIFMISNEYHQTT